MKKLIFLTLLMFMTVFSSFAQAVVTERLSPNALDVLLHENVYIWRMNGLAVPDGENITGAGLTFYHINNWREPDNDMLYIHLMDSSQISDARNALDMWAINNRVYTGHDILPSGDDLANYGVLLDTYQDDNAYQNGWRWVNPAENYSYEFDSGEVSLLESIIGNNGIVGIGLDSDCRYEFTSDCVIEFWYTTSPVIPAPGAVLLSGIGVVIVGWMRRRKTL